MPPGQTLDPEPALAEPLLRQIDLPVLEGVLITAAHHERELIAKCLEEPTEVEAIALGLVMADGS